MNILTAALPQRIVANTLYSCVVDRQPLYRFQGLLFAQTLVNAALSDCSVRCAIKP
jgi:hypothetical protein